jgi:hypothetical protein
MKKILFYIFILIIIISIYKKKNQHDKLYKKIPKNIINKYNFKFDIVITWVDWSNKKFIKKYNKAGNTHSKPCKSNKFLELKFAIRSLFKHNIKFRNLYIVHSDNHPPPKYLKKNNPRLIFIPHSKIAKKKSHLPLIHRESITINLHRIPGILNYYFYMEDDMLIHNPNMFYKQLELFEDKKQIVYTRIKIFKFERNPKAPGGLWKLNLYNSNNLFNKNKNFFEKNFIILWEDHNVWLYNKKIVNEIEKKYDKYFTMTSSYKKICNSKHKEKYYIGIQNIYLNYLIYKLNFKPIKNPNLVNYLHTNIFFFGINKNKISNFTIPLIKIYLKNYKKTMFTNIQGPGISDEYENIPVINKLVYGWLNKIYPKKSEFEI